MVDIKSNEKSERATTRTKATKNSKKQRRATKSRNGHRSLKNQNRQQKAQKFRIKTRLKALKKMHQIQQNVFSWIKDIKTFILFNSLYHAMRKRIPTDLKITLKMADHKRSETYRVFTMILCGL